MSIQSHKTSTRVPNLLDLVGADSVSDAFDLGPSTGDDITQAIGTSVGDDSNQSLGPSVGDDAGASST